MGLFYISYFFRPIITPEAIVAYRLFEVLRNEYKVKVYALAPGKHLCTGKIDESIGFVNDPDVIYLDTKRPVQSKVLKGLVFCFKAVVYMLKNSEGNTVVLSRSTPMLSHIPALFVQKKKWIVSYSDPPGGGAVARLSAFIVRTLVSRNADCILIPSVRMGRYYTGLRTLYLPHFVKAEVEKNTHFKCNDSTNYYHFGNLYASRDCRRFLESLRQASLEQVEDAKLIVYGFVGKQILDDIVACNLSKYIEVRGYIAHADYIELLKSMKNAILFDMNIDGSPYMPSKLVEYLEYGNDITVVTTQASEVESIAHNHHLRLIYYSDDVVTYIEKLRCNYERKPNMFNLSSEFMQYQLKRLCDELSDPAGINA